MRASRRASLAALATAAGIAAAAPLPAHAAPPSNDNFANAAPLSAPPSIRLGTVDEATREPGEPQHAEAGTGGTVWYRWTAPRNEVISLSTCSTRFDTVLAVYTGDSVSTLTPVTSDDDACNNLGSRVAFPAQAGTTYRIAVGSFEPLAAEDSGRFHLVATRVVRPRNDNFRSPQRIRLRQRAILNTEQATRERGERAHEGENPPTHSVWFSFRPRRTQRVRASTFASSFDTILAVYELRGGRLRRIAANDDTEGETFASRVRFRAIAGRSYRIAVDGFRGSAGDLVLRLHR